MVGRKPTNPFPLKNNKPGETLLEVAHLIGTYSLPNDVSFSAHRGEFVGFAMLTEERRATGIFGILSVRENTVISGLHKPLCMASS